MFTGQVSLAKSPYRASIADDLVDPEWDAFVAAIHAHHVQTSAWAQLKADLNWRTSRIVIRDAQRIMAGAQMLFRSINGLIRVGYITKGPIFVEFTPELLHLVMDQIFRLVRAHRIQFLVIQPPNDGELIAVQLARYGFRPSWLEVAPTATIVIDLEQDLETMLANMKRQNRQNIRRSERDGITVREGTHDDLETFYQLHVRTSKRQSFVPYTDAYFRKMWELFQPAGHIALLMACHQAEVISALLLVPFGDTVLAKILGWSGEYGSSRPNEALFWGAIQWAKAHPYPYFDFEGIDPAAAELLLPDQPLPESMRTGATFFKLMFGGQVVLYPHAYDYVPNPVLRPLYNAISPRLQTWSPLYVKLLDRIRR